MEDIFTLLLIIFVVYIIYKYGNYKKMEGSPPCKIIYKIKEEKNVI
jgi:hypothetical protein